MFKLSVAWLNFLFAKHKQNSIAKTIKFSTIFYKSIQFKNITQNLLRRKKIEWTNNYFKFLPMETKIFKGKIMVSFARMSTCTFVVDYEKEIWLCQLCQVLWPLDTMQAQCPCHLPGDALSQVSIWAIILISPLEIDYANKLCFQYKRNET